MSENQYFPSYTIYRTKVASRFQMRIGKNQKDVEKTMMFWSAAEPDGGTKNGKPTFAWDQEKSPGKQVNMLLGEKDVGELLAVLDGYKDAVGYAPKNMLYHKNPRGNSSLSFSATEKGYQYRISSQVDGQVKAFTGDVSFDEAMVLKVLLRDFISRKYGWR